MRKMVLQGRATEAVAGDFAVQVKGDVVEVPANLMTVLERNRVQTPEELVSLVMSFPSQVAQQLDWSVEQVRQASDRLCHQLEGHLPHALLSPPAWPPRPGGARPPAETDPPT